MGKHISVQIGPYYFPTKKAAKEHAKEILNSYPCGETIPEPHEFYKTSRWAMAHPNDVIGMEQSGTCGFFARNVINLDGKVNYEALKARKADDLGSYINQRGINYIADWPDLALPMVASTERHGAKFECVDTIGKIIIFKRIQ